MVRRPVVRSQGLLIESVGDETVIYDKETKEAHCLKPFASVIFAHADGTNTVAELAELATAELNAAYTENDVHQALGQLEASRLLDVPLLVQSGISRRQMVRRIGWAGAAVVGASPLITSIVAPTAAIAGASQIPAGCTGCSQNKDCQSGHCCQSVAGKSCNQTCCVGADNSCHISGSSCTVQLSGCPCICGAPGCGLPAGQCCPAGTTVCCTT